MHAAWISVRQRQGGTCFITQSAYGSNCAVGGCKPFKLYPGWMVTDYGCTSSGCKSSTVEASGFDECVSACQQAGYSKCKSLQYQDAEAFGLKGGQCTMFDTRIEFMGAHAAVELLQVLTDGKPAITSASYCQPPEAFAKYPGNERVDFGAIHTPDIACEGLNHLPAVKGCKKDPNSWCMR